MSPEQRYRLELAKERTPSTSAFVWVIPAFLALAWLCQNTDAGKEIAEAVPEVHFVQQQAQPGQFARYPHGDPSCHGEFWCFAGWRL